MLLAPLTAIREPNPAPEVLVLVRAPKLCRTLRWSLVLWRLLRPLNISAESSGLKSPWAPWRRLGCSEAFSPGPNIMVGLPWSSIIMG